MPSRVALQYLPATDRSHRRVLADDEPVAWKRERLLLQSDLDEGLISRFEPFASEQRNIPHDLGSSDVEADALALTDRPRR